MSREQIVETLLTGNTVLVTQKWIRAAFPQDHVLLASQRTEADSTGRRVVLDSKQRLEQLVETYAFDRIVYFSEYLTPHSEQEGELERLRRLLQANRERPVQFLYLAGPESALTPPTGKTVLAQSAEHLCQHYARNSSIQLRILRLPYLYALDVPQVGGGLAGLFRQVRQGRLHFDEPAEQPVFALCMEDLAGLLARLFDSWPPVPETLTIPVPSLCLHEDLGAALARVCPGLKITYGTDQLRQYPAGDEILRRQYGWFAKYSLREDLLVLWDSWQKVCPPPEEQGRKLWTAQGRRCRVLLELLAAWAVTEGLVQLTGTQAQFRMVDFRLLFVVLAGTLYGLNPGVLAAVLAGASLVWGYVRQGTAPVLLFYEPSYWLSFLVYFVAGAVCGYVQRRSADTVHFAREETSQLRQQLEFVRQLYQDTLAEKRALTKQLLGRRDSFGKIYTVVRQLDAAQPQLLYRNAVQAMTDVLQNRNIALYRPTEQGRFARLVAADPACGHREQQLPPQVLRQLWPVLDQGNLWVNRELRPGLPMYAAAARHRDEPVLLLLLWDAGEKQLTLYEQNLFQILSGLVETALCRALAYDAAIRREQVLPGTRLLNPAAFTRRLAASCALQQAGMSSHLLLRVRSGGWNTSDLWERLRAVCREGDALGQAADHSLCILLEQADDAALPGITRRLAAQGIAVQAVSGEEQRHLAGAQQEERI